jgi:uncharacterized protein (DUF849 family)
MTPARTSNRRGCQRAALVSTSRHRLAVPILIQLSTGVGLAAPFTEREPLVELRPGMATLSPCTMTFGSGEFPNPSADVARLARRIAELGVKPELEIYDTGHLDACLRMRDAGLLTEFSVTAAGWPSAKLSLGKRVARPAIRDLDLTQKAPGGSKAVAAKFGPLGP